MKTTCILLVSFSLPLAVCLLATSLAYPADAAPSRLKVGVVQMAVAQTVEANRDRIVFGIAQAAASGVRVAVFPEGVLRGQGGDDQTIVSEAVETIRRAARQSRIYVVFGGFTYLPHLKKDANWMLVLSPEGRDLFRYEKLYDNHRAAMPGVFRIDGIPCNAMICADRWLRGVEEIPIQAGAQISFELSRNFAAEWVAPFGWYWYVPRAMRNNAWVIFANAGNKVSGVPDNPSEPHELRHGHSAIIAPDGRIAAAAQDDKEAIVVGMEHRRDGTPRNSAFVIGPDGTVLTRYDQLSAASPFQPGDDPSAMWFRVKGVPAVVTIGRDALWTELAELAAVAGTQIHVHLDHDPATDQDAALRRLQVWSNMASFQTFTATVNPVGSVIWDDLRDAEERRAEVRDLPRPDTGSVEVYSPFSANLVVRAGQTRQLITATRHVGPQNRYHPSRTSNFNPQMDAWYRLGAAILHPQAANEPLKRRTP